MRKPTNCPQTRAVAGLGRFFEFYAIFQKRQICEDRPRILSRRKFFQPQARPFAKNTPAKAYAQTHLKRAARHPHQSTAQPETAAWVCLPAPAGTASSLRSSPVLPFRLDPTDLAWSRADPLGSPAAGNRGSTKHCLAEPPRRRTHERRLWRSRSSIWHLGSRFRTPKTPTIVVAADRRVAVWTRAVGAASACDFRPSCHKETSVPYKHITCPDCRKRSGVFVIGESVRCPKCGATMPVSSGRQHRPEREAAPLGDALTVTPTGLAATVRLLADSAGRTLRADFDELLGALALHLSDGDERAAAKMLRALMWMPDARARAAAQAGRGALIPGGETILGGLAGVELNGDAVKFLYSVVGGEATAEAPRKRGLSVQAVTRNASTPSLLGRALKAVDTPDFPTRAAAVALIESSLGSVGELGQHLRVATPHDPDSDAVLADRLLAAIYALRTTRLGGLPIANVLWREAAPDWCRRAAPWVLPVIHPEENTALMDVLNGMVEHGLDFVPPGSDPFASAWEPERMTEWVEGVRGKATAVSPMLTRLRDWPIFFDGPSEAVQVLLSEDEHHAVGWVGRDNRGMLVCFDRDEFVPYGLGEVGFGFALGCAISWFVDCTISLRKEPLGRKAPRHPANGRSAPVRYWPTPIFASHRRQVANGSMTPPRPSIVAAHVRNLGDGQPSDKQLSQAPRRLLRRMGPHDTWVRQHRRGGGAPPQDIVNRLSRYSALADSLGLLDQHLRSTR